jgi:hypothetical protein
VYALTDSSGRYRIWDLPPFEPVAIAIDVGSLDSPLWAADVQRAVLIPAPNHLEHYDMIVVPGGVVEGTVLDGRGMPHPIPGARVRLREVGGTHMLETTTFSDGGFSFIGVKPGRWTASIVAEDLATLGGASNEVAFAVRSLANGDRVAGIELVVRAKP